MLQASLFLIIYDQSFLISSFNVRLTNFFCFGGEGVLSTFLLDNSSFSVPPPDNYCTVPYDHNSSQTICITLNKTVLKGYVRAISLKSKTLSVTAHHLNSNYNGPEVCC